MHYATIKYCDIANGVGVRTSLFVSGCTHRCKGCFNPEAWDFQYGAPFTKEVQDEILASLAPTYINGLTLLGGEPFEPQNRAALISLCQAVRAAYPQKSIWCYTGFVLEDLLSGKAGNPESARQLLALLDVLVDGPFVEAQKNIQLKFRGSENQRILLVAETLQSQAPVLYAEMM